MRRRRSAERTWSAVKFLLSLDYELFFGSAVGSVARCMLEPTEALRRAIAPFGVKLTLFVDGTFLLRLSEEVRRHRVLQVELDAIRGQLARLVAQGHDVQLHVHPHWVDAAFDGTRWCVPTGRYRLHDFQPEDRVRIVSDSKSVLEQIVGPRIFAFRAGGWCLQPFDAIAAALRRAGIWLDSTVYRGGLAQDPDRRHDFRGAPGKVFWRFEEDPMREEANGAFYEIPITSFSASPLLFWRMGLAKRLAPQRHRAFGDGAAIGHTAGYYLARLLVPSRSVASVDGMKAGSLADAFRQWRRESGSELFHVMGHPKALTRYSLERVRDFLGQVRHARFVTLADFAHLKGRERV